MHNHDHGDPLRPTPLGRPREPKKGRRGVNPTFQAMIEAHDWKDKWVVDIGCGTGAGAVLMGKLGANAVGVDVDAEVLVKANERAKEEGQTENVRFLCADVELAEYDGLTGGPLDGVLAHLCFSTDVAKRAGRALKPGGLFFIRTFEKDMWKESGPASDFAYKEGELRTLLKGAGFKVNKLRVERRVQTFGSMAEFEKSMLWDEHRRADWEESGRLARLKNSFAKGNHDLTEAFIVVEAQRVAERAAKRAPPKRKRASAKRKTAPRRSSRRS